MKCRANVIALNPSKMYVAVTPGVFLRYVTSQTGKELDHDKIEVITNLIPPTTVKGIQSIAHLFIMSAQNTMDPKATTE